MNIGQGNFPIIQGQNANPLMRGISQGLMQYQQFQENQKRKALMPFLVPTAQAALDSSQLQNQATQMNNRWIDPKAMSQLSLQGAQTNEANQVAAGQGLANQFMPQKTQSAIDLQKAQADYYNMGGGRGGVSNKNQLFLDQQTKADNPNFTPAQVRQASDAIQNGQSALPDGTPINVTNHIKNALDATIKGNTTAPLITQSVKANQAEAELSKMAAMADVDNAPYAKTYFGKSPQQILDTFKTDKESQTRLGNFMAAQAAQYEISQQRNRVAGGQPGVGSTEELMKMSMQRINSEYPELSAAARQQASKRLDEYLKSGLDARNAVGLRPSDINKKTSDSASSKPKNMVWANGKLVPEGAS
jgi:hypothetical protein